ncbi:MAG TPA: DUF5671 domain-containing protein [Anaerolineales bacterium]|nr:DUF5671 domain-containing protein [Anaerolineales bacterium]
MAAIRRLYLYTTAFVSLEVVLWGTIGLVRSLFAGSEIGGEASRLAGALSLILVGLPVFLVHWILIQRSANRDIEERSARTRAIFFYGILAATLAAVLQNALALANRSLLDLLGADPQQALLGGNQTSSDNLVAIALNLILAAYFFYSLRQDWAAPVQGDAYPETRRLFRYLWLVYSLALVGFGVQQIVSYVLFIPAASGSQMVQSLANGLALLILGIPLWVFTWRLLVRTSTEPGERDSLMRQAFLHGIVFIGIVGALASSWQILVQVFQTPFGEVVDLAEFLQGITQPVSLALPFVGIWLYYGRVLRREAGSAPETSPFETLRQLYLYLLSLLGLAATFAGLHLLLSLLFDLWPGIALLGEPSLRNRLASALATLIVGLPLWLLVWGEIAQAAAHPGETGERARRSTVRKTYLYFVLFASVLGVMFTTGQLLFQLISALLGDPANDLQIQVLQILKTMALFAVLLTYHWRVLRKDARLAETTLSRRHTLYPVLILDPEQDGFAESLLAALEHQAPALPVAVHPIAQGAPDETLSAAKAVILPGGQLAQLPEALRLWLQSYPGARLALPSRSEGWTWIGGPGKSIDPLARQAAVTIRRLAEGEQISPNREGSPWMTLVYILAGLFVIEVLLAVVAFFFSLFAG